jgi:hypothetical protein
MKVALPLSGRTGIIAKISMMVISVNYMGSLALIFSPLLSAVTSVELATMKLHVPLKSQQIIPELIINGTSNRLDIFLVIFLSSFAKSMHTGFANMPSSFVDTLSES